MPGELDYRTPEWLAEQLDIDKNAVYRYLNEGTLPGLQLGRKWLISESTVLAFLKDEEARQTAERRRIQGGPHEKFSDESHRAIAAAQVAAVERGHNWVGTEHLLLAALDQACPRVVRMLQANGSEPEQVRSSLLRAMEGFGPSTNAGSTHGIGMTPRAKKALDLAAKEAESTGVAQAGPEHLVVGLAVLGEGIASDVLKSVGITAAALQGWVRQNPAEA